MNIPPVGPIPNFRPGERQEDGPAARRPAPPKSSEGKKRRRPSQALTENLLPHDYDTADGPTDGDHGSELGRFTDQSV